MSVDRDVRRQGPEVLPELGDGLGAASYTSTTNDADRDLIANATAVAQLIDERHGFGAGIIRQLARRLAELAPTDPIERRAGCKNCGDPLEQPATGRPRTYCPRPQCQTASRRGGKTREKAMLRAGGMS